MYTCINIQNQPCSKPYHFSKSTLPIGKGGSDYIEWCSGMVVPDSNPNMEVIQHWEWIRQANGQWVTQWRYSRGPSDTCVNCYGTRSSDAKKTKDDNKTREIQNLRKSSRQQDGASVWRRESVLILVDVEEEGSSTAKTGKWITPDGNAQGMKTNECGDDDIDWRNNHQDPKPKPKRAIQYIHPFQYAKKPKIPSDVTSA